MLPISDPTAFSDPSGSSPPLSIPHGGAFFPRTEDAASLFFVSPPKPAGSSSEDEGLVRAGLRQRQQVTEEVAPALPSVCASSYNMPGEIEGDREEQRISWGAEGRLCSPTGTTGMRRSEPASSFCSYQVCSAEASSPIPAPSLPSPAFPPPSPFPPPSFYPAPFPSSGPPSFPPPSVPSQDVSRVSSFVSNSSCPPYQECTQLPQAGQSPLQGIAAHPALSSESCSGDYSSRRPPGYTHPSWPWSSAATPSVPSPCVSPACAPSLVAGRPSRVAREGLCCGAGGGGDHAQYFSSCCSETCTVAQAESPAASAGMQHEGSSPFAPCSFSTRGCRQAESGQTTSFQYAEPSSAPFVAASSSLIASSCLSSPSLFTVSPSLSLSSSQLPLQGGDPSQGLLYTGHTAPDAPACPGAPAAGDGVSCSGGCSVSSPRSPRPGSRDCPGSSSLPPSSDPPPFLQCSPSALSMSLRPPDTSSAPPSAPRPSSSSSRNPQSSASSSLSTYAAASASSAPAAPSVDSSSYLSFCAPSLFPCSSLQDPSALSSSSIPPPSSCVGPHHVVPPPAVQRPEELQQGPLRSQTKERMPFNGVEENNGGREQRRFVQPTSSRCCLRVASRFPSTLTTTPAVAAALGLGHSASWERKKCRQSPCSSGEDEDEEAAETRSHSADRSREKQGSRRGGASGTPLNSLWNENSVPSFSSVLLFLAGSTLEARGLKDAADVVYAQSRELVKAEKVLTCHDYRGEERVVDAKDRSLVLPSFDGGLNWRLTSPAGMRGHGEPEQSAGDGREDEFLSDGRAARSLRRSSGLSSSSLSPVSSYSRHEWESVRPLSDRGSPLEDCRRFISDLVSLLFSHAPGHMSLQDFLSTCWPTHLPRPLPRARLHGGGGLDSFALEDEQRKRRRCRLCSSCRASFACLSCSSSAADEPARNGRGSCDASAPPRSCARASLPTVGTSSSGRPDRSLFGTPFQRRSAMDRTNIFLLHRGRRLRPALSPLLPHSSLSSCSDSNSTASALAVSSAVASSFVSPLSCSPHSFPSSVTAQRSIPSAVGLPSFPGGAHVPSTAAFLAGSGPSLTSQDSTACWLAWARRVRRVANVWGHQLSHDDLLSGNRPAVEPQFQAGMVREPAAVYVVRYDTSGGAILTGGDDGLIKVWEASSGQLVHVLVKHQGDVTDVDLHANNSLVLSGCGKGEVRLWRLLPGGWLPVCALLVPERVAWTRFLTREPLTRSEVKDLKSPAEKGRRWGPGGTRAASRQRDRDTTRATDSGEDWRSEKKDEARAPAGGETLTKQEREEARKRGVDLQEQEGYNRRAEDISRREMGVAAGEEGEMDDEGLDPISLIVVGCDDGKIRFFDLRNLLESEPIGGPGGRTTVAPLIEVNWGGTFLARAMDLSKVSLRLTTGMNIGELWEPMRCASPWRPCTR